MTEFEACFTFACPKFLSAIPPSLEEPPTAAGEALHKEPLRLQMKVFMDEVKQQMLLPTVRSYLKLYTSMPLEKLADYMSITGRMNFKINFVLSRGSKKYTQPLLICR